jgi:hypothetical protein
VILGGACCGAAASPSSAPSPGRSRPALIATPSPTGSSRCWTPSRTESSPSTSSGLWGPAHRGLLLGETRQAKPAVHDLPPHPWHHLLPRLLFRGRRPAVGRQPTSQGHRQHTGRAQVDPRRPTRRRPDPRHPGQPLYTPARTSAAGRRETSSSCALPRPTLPEPTRSRPTSARCGSSRHRSHSAQTQVLHRYLRRRNTNARHPRRTHRPTQGTRSHPERKGHPLGRTPPQYRSLTKLEPQPPSTEGGKFRRRTATEG